MPGSAQARDLISVQAPQRKVLGIAWQAGLPPMVPMLPLSSSRDMSTMVASACAQVPAIALGLHGATDYPRCPHAQLTCSIVSMDYKLHLFCQTKLTYKMNVYPSNLSKITFFVILSICYLMINYNFFNYIMKILLL